MTKFFFSRLIEYFLRYRDFTHFLVLGYDIGPQHEILREIYSSQSNARYPCAKSIGWARLGHLACAPGVSKVRHHDSGTLVNMENGSVRFVDAGCVPTFFVFNGSVGVFVSTSVGGT